MRVWLLILALGVVLISACAALLMSPRPADTTEAAVLAGDGGALDYCTLPVAG